MIHPLILLHSALLLRPVLRASCSSAANGLSNHRQPPLRRLQRIGQLIPTPIPELLIFLFIHRLRLARQRPTISRSRFSSSFMRA